MSKKRELIFSVTKKDLEIQTFRAGGKGGQNQNKRDTGVRLIHKASGAVAESREERSQKQNMRSAFKKLVSHPKFKVWTNRKLLEHDKKKTVEQMVDEAMASNNLKVEVFEDKQWVEKRL